MNIFILDNDIRKSAQYHVDRHVIKMPLELAQMICSTYLLLDYKNLPSFIFSKPSHVNHPCTKWIRSSKDNFIYGCMLGLALYDEYQFRYENPEKMQRVKKVFEYGLSYVPDRIEHSEFTEFAQAMPIQYRNKDAVKAYRKYYIGEKQHLFKWTKRERPDWLTGGAKWDVALL